MSLIIPRLKRVDNLATVSAALSVRGGVSSRIISPNFSMTAFLRAGLNVALTSLRMPSMRSVSG